MCRAKDENGGRRCEHSTSGKRTPKQRAEANARARAKYAASKGGKVRGYTTMRAPRRVAPAGVTVEAGWVTSLPRDVQAARAGLEVRVVRITPGYVTLAGEVTDAARTALATEPAKLALLFELTRASYPERTRP